MKALSGFLGTGSQIRGCLSLDRVTFLVFSPRLSLWGEEIEENKKRVEKMASLLEKLLSDSLDCDFPQGHPSELFLKHYRTSDGVDIQFGPFMPRRKKISDESFVSAFGTIADKEKGFIMKSFPNDYAFRVEFNPNNSDLTSVSSLLQNFSISGLTSSLVKIARLDIAVDYSTSISPALTFCDGMCKSFIACGTTGIETVYFGSRASKYFIRLYNKAVELREKQNIEVSGDLWRFELECKDSFSLDEFPDFGKVLKRFHFYSSGIQTDDWKFNLLVAYSSQMGIKSALSFLPRTTQQRYKKLFALYEEKSIEHPEETYYREFPAVFSSLRSQILTSFGYKVESFL